MIAIPTTAGSGSEATYFIVYYIGKEKQSEGTPNVTLPDYSISDPQFTISLPAQITASTGMDALSQAIESYWSVNSTSQSRQFSQKAINLLLKNLEQAVNTPSLNSRENVMRAANLAGKAINITKTTAPHSISYPITSYFQIPHGHAVALTLGEMLIYNSNVNEEDCLDKRGKEYVKATIQEINNMLGVSASIQARGKIQALMNQIGLETKLSKLGFNSRDIGLIIEKGFNLDRIKGNPRRLTRKGLRFLLNSIY